MTDVISFGSEEARRFPRLLIVAGVMVLIGGAIVYVSTRGRPDASPPVAGPTSATATETAAPVERPAGAPCFPVGWGQQPPVADPVAGLRIDGQPTVGGLDRCDRTVAEGAWTVVVRRVDGSFGRRGAVVTYPAEPVVSGRSVDIGVAAGRAGTGTVTWPLAGQPARVRGDLPEADLVAIATRTRVESGRPAVEAPDGFTVIATGPYRSPTVHEMRYGSGSVGEGAALGNGLTLTGVASGGGYEDLIYTLTTRDGAPVGGRPTVVSDGLAGSGGIAWEPAPGMVAYIGYSGSLMDEAAVAALQRLAARARAMTSAQWTEAGAFVSDQTNAPG